MIIEIFMPQTQPIDALPNQFFDRVLDQPRIAMIDEALRKPGDDPRPRLDFTQQQTASVRRDRPPSNRATTWRRPNP